MWLFLDMNAFFASCEQQDRAELRGRPIGVVPMLADTTCCIAASYEAKCSGVKTGTGVAAARELCPNIAFIEARPRLYRATHFRIIEAVEKIVPIHQILSVDEMVVQPWRNEDALVDALRLGQRVQDAIRYNVGEWLSCSIGLAPNAFLAKVASDLQKPRGLSVIGLDDIPHKLYCMKLSDWPGIGKAMERRFNAVGISTTAEMYTLSMSKMRDIFGGIVGERWWRLIRGENVALPAIKRWQIGHSNVLAPEFRTPEGAWSIACRLLEKAAERMRGEGYHACRLTVGVSSFTGAQWSRSVKFAPCSGTVRLQELLTQLWQGAKIVTPSHVNVALQDIINDDDLTQDLFYDPKESALETAMDHVNQRYGRGTVTTASSLAVKDYLDHARIPFGKPAEMR